jgi:ABC-type thiamine transport system ATPase subunit
LEPGGPGRCSAILELRDLVVAVGGGGRAEVSLFAREAELAVVTAGADAATALARVVAGLAPPVSGRILVGDRDVTALPPGSRQIGYVPHGGALLPHLTVRQNIEYLVWRQESVHEIVRGWASTLIYQLELGPVLDQRPHEITAQQRMRGALARAVVSLPEVLVFERPDPAVCGPLDDLLARIESPVSAAPATVVFGDPQAAPEGAPTVPAIDRTAVTHGQEGMPREAEHD